MSELSEYEKKRNKIIQENRDMLLSLNLPIAGSEPAHKRPKLEVRGARSRPREKPQPRNALPTRRSARVAGNAAEPGASLKQLEALDLLFPTRTERKQRKLGVIPLESEDEGEESEKDIKLETEDVEVKSEITDTKTDGTETKTGDTGKDVLADSKHDIDSADGVEARMRSQYLKDASAAMETISEDTKHSGHKEVEQMIRKWEIKTDQVCKVSKERIMHLAYHPTTSKRIVFAGNKLGEVSIWDVNREYDEAYDHLVAPSYRLHSRPVTALIVNPFDHTQLYSSSYDGSALVFDVRNQNSDAFYVDEEVMLTSCVPSRTQDKVVYLADGQGQMVVCDLRIRNSKSGEGVAMDLKDLHNKKISCIDSHPSKALLVTSSLDRTARIWDLRQMKSKNGSVKPIAEQTCRLSVSSGYFSPSGAKVITTGMDDTIKVWDYTETPKTKPSTSEKATVVTKHYNQTGRWVTNFRAKFIGENHFHIGNMKRSVDIYAENGVLVRQLSDDEHMTAIPAVNDYHPGHGELAAGTHGKVHIYSNTDDSRQ